MIKVNYYNLKITVNKKMKRPHRILRTSQQKTDPKTNSYSSVGTKLVITIPQKASLLNLALTSQPSTVGEPTKSKIPKPSTQIPSPLPPTSTSNHSSQNSHSLQLLIEVLVVNQWKSVQAMQGVKVVSKTALRANLYYLKI